MYKSIFFEFRLKSKIFFMLNGKRKIKDTKNELKNNQQSKSNLAHQELPSQRLLQLLDRSCDLHLPFGRLPMIKSGYFRKRD